jgi:hypothetical protein
LQDHSQESSSCSVCKEILSVLRNSKIHYRVHKSPPHVFILCHMNQVHTLLPYFFRIHLILPSRLCMFSKWSLQIFPTTDLHAFVCVPCTHFITPDLIFVVKFGIQIMKVLILQISLASCYLPHLYIKYFFQYSVLIYPHSSIPPMATTPPPPKLKTDKLQQNSITIKNTTFRNIVTKAFTILETVLFKVLHIMFRLLPINGHNINKRFVWINFFIWQREMQTGAASSVLSRRPCCHQPEKDLRAWGPTVTQCWAFK